MQSVFWIGLLAAQAVLDIQKAIFHFVLAPPSPTIWGRLHYTYTTQETRQVWHFGRGLVLDSLKASFPLSEIRQDTSQEIVEILAAALPSGPLELQVWYHGTPQSTGFGSFEVKAHETGYVLWTLSEPYGAKDWLFCQNTLADKIDSLEMIIDTPPEYVSVGNGLLLSDSLLPSGYRRRHFRHRYPIATYLIAIAASNYLILTDTVTTPWHSFVVKNYVFPQDSARASALMETFKPYFTWIEERLGPYPFADEGYNQVQIGWGGGMEHQTITFFGSYSPELWAHELAHQWFGDLVTCASWRDIWLHEAFATLLGGKVYEALPTGLWPRWHYLAIRGAWSDTVQTIYIDDTSTIQRIFSYPTTYLKGAIALESLREYLGDSVFWQGLRYFLERYRYGFATTSQFEEALRSKWPVLARWVQSWIYTPGFPRLWVQWHGPQRLTLWPEVPYPLWVPLRAYLAGGDSLEEHVDLSRPFTLETLAPIASIVLDPDTTTPLLRPRPKEVARYPPILFPNPASTTLQVGPLPAGLELRLYNPSGQLLWKGATLTGFTPIELNHLGAQGLYLLCVQGPNSAFCKKFSYLKP